MSNKEMCVCVSMSHTEGTGELALDISVVLDKVTLKQRAKSSTYALAESIIAGHMLAVVRKSVLELLDAISKHPEMYQASGGYLRMKWQEQRLIGEIERFVHEATAYGRYEKRLRLMWNDEY